MEYLIKHADDPFFEKGVLRIAVTEDGRLLAFHNNASLEIVKIAHVKAGSEK